MPASRRKIEVTNFMSEKKYKTSIGGQAVIEGVMMRGPKDYAVAVRKPALILSSFTRYVNPSVSRSKI